jgi:Tfp pilus assembly protein PilP
MRWQTLIAISLLASACGGDEPPPPPPKKAAAAGGGAAAKGGAAGKEKQLQARKHVEESVACPLVEKATGPKCDPAAPTCEVGLYCIPVKGGGNNCEPCPEKDSIRHEFKDRDFVADQVRDPFQSFIIVPKGLEAVPDKKVEGPCTRPEQFVASNYSYLDMRLVGIVAQGTQRKALMMDRANVGRIVRRGDCVGKEKAVVKDIGPGFVTFVVHPDVEDRTPNRVPEERSVQLYPKGLQVAPDSQPEVTPVSPTAPIVAPPPAP